MRIGFVGGGVMAEAIIGGILDAGLARPEDVGVGEPLEARRRHLAGKYGVAASGENSEALDGAEMAILAVKPQSIREALADIRPSVGGCVVMSIAAGVRMATLAEGLGHRAVIRVMPNTPAQIGKGMTVWTAAAEVPSEAVDAARGILGTLGDELYVEDEKLIDMATALSASGPAYVFLFVESLIDAGVYLGMPRDVARRLALQTVAGSVSLMQESGRHPAELKDMVTSPGGTTAEALLAFERAGFTGTVIDAVNAAYEKSKSLGGPG